MFHDSAIGLCGVDSGRHKDCGGAWQKIIVDSDDHEGYHAQRKGGCGLLWMVR